MDVTTKMIIIVFGLVGAAIFFFNVVVHAEEIDYSQYEYHKNTAFGEVWVEENTLYINNRDQCSWDYPENASERMMVDYSLEANPASFTALNIGLGCGLTAQRALDNGLQLDVVEINPAVIDVNRQFSNITYNKNLNLIRDDGLRHLRTTDKSYDIILVDVENPEVAHSSNLYTKEFFSLVNDKLNYGGAFSLWAFDLYYANTEFQDIMYWTLKEEFVYVYKYPDVFVATDYPLNREEYKPTIEKKVNSLEHKIITR